MTVRYEPSVLQIIDQMKSHLVEIDKTMPDLSEDTKCVVAAYRVCKSILKQHGETDGIIDSEQKARDRSRNISWFKELKTELRTECPDAFAEFSNYEGAKLRTEREMI
jgi:hypothetical protein